MWLNLAKPVRLYDIEYLSTTVPFFMVPHYGTCLHQQFQKLMLNVSTRVLNVSTRALSVSTRALNISIRALYGSTRALYGSTRALYGSTRDSMAILEHSIAVGRHLSVPDVYCLHGLHR